jgi:hypothetical protein
MPLSEFDDALTISAFGLMFNSQSCSCFSYGYNSLVSCGHGFFRGLIRWGLLI